MTDKPIPSSDKTPDATTQPKGDQLVHKGDQSLTSAIAAGALRKCQEEFNGDHAQAVCSANILRAFAKNGNDPTLTEKDGKFEFGPPNFARATRGDSSNTEQVAVTTAATSEKPAEPAVTAAKPAEAVAPAAQTDATPKVTDTPSDAAQDKPIVKAVTFDGQTGTQTSIVHKNEHGDFVSGVIKYDGVRASKDLKIDDGANGETRRITGIKEQKFEDDPQGARLTLTTENGTLRFTETAKGWRQDAGDVAVAQPAAKVGDPAVTSTSKEVTVGGQKGIETTSERRNDKGDIVAGSVSYDGVRVAKVVPVDTGSVVEPHRFTGIQSSTVEQTPDGIRMTLVTDKGNYAFTKTEKGWHAESDVSQVPLVERSQTRGLPGPGLPTEPSTDATKPAAPAQVEAHPPTQTPFIPRDTDQPPGAARPSDGAPDSAPSAAPEGRDQLL